MLLRRTAAAALVTALAVTGVALAAAPAAAVSSYRYWSYWTVAPGAPAWTYSGVGPAGHRVDDGGVEGWRFVVAAPNPSAPGPRTSAAAAFQAICGGTVRPAGKDRVALVVDFGTQADAPPHESPPAKVVGTCVVVDDRSDGLDVLGVAGYAPRMGSGLVCGLSGYPAHECGVVVKASPTPRPTPTRTTPTPSAPTTPGPSLTKTQPPTAPAGGASGTSGANPSRTPAASATSASPTTASPTTAAPTPSAADPGASDPALAVGPPPASPGGTSSGTPAGLLLGALVVLGVGAAAVLRTRSHGTRHGGTA